MPLLRFIESLVKCAIIISLIWAAPAMAEGKEPTDEDKARAAKAFGMGQDLLANGEYVGAASAFE